jgi:hypothetical protein
LLDGRDVDWVCLQMSLVWPCIHAAHLTTCRGIIEQLEQVEIDELPTAFVTDIDLLLVSGHRSSQLVAHLCAALALPTLRTAVPLLETEILRPSMIGVMRRVIDQEWKVIEQLEIPTEWDAWLYSPLRVSSRKEWLMRALVVLKRQPVSSDIPRQEGGIVTWASL